MIIYRQYQRFFHQAITIGSTKVEQKQLRYFADQKSVYKVFQIFENLI